MLRISSTVFILDSSSFLIGSGEVEHSTFARLGIHETVPEVVKYLSRHVSQ